MSWQSGEAFGGSWKHLQPEGMWEVLKEPLHETEAKSGIIIFKKLV